MLKITTLEGSNGTTLNLDGRLAGPWVEELARSWRSTVATSGQRPILVDLSEVTFIDADGKKLLAQMFQQGAEFHAAGCMTKCIVEEIKRGVGTPPFERRRPTGA
jgi:anti-anti-sigma regulatory factor